MDTAGADVAYILDDFINDMTWFDVSCSFITTNEVQNYSFHEGMYVSNISRFTYMYNNSMVAVYSVGVADSAALARGMGIFYKGDNISAGVFNYAVSLMLADESVGSLSEGSFSDYGGYADLASHDALIAVVMAAANANSTSPTDITRALNELVLEPETSPVSIEMDFTNQNQPTRQNGIIHADVIDVYRYENVSPIIWREF